MKLPTLSLPLFALSLLTTSIRANVQTDFLAQADASPDGIIKLDSAGYDKLVSSPPGSPRNYSVTVVLTALPSQFKCQPCHLFDPTYKTVSESWKRAAGEDRKDHFFAQLDFNEGQAIFSRLGLQSAPNLQFFPPRGGPRKSDSRQDFVTYDFSRNGFSVESFHGWISQLTPKPFPIYVPFNPIPYILIPLISVGSILGLYFSSPYLLPLIQSKVIWQGLSLVGILVFTSGHMWNKIRGAPYQGQDGQFIMPGFSQQYVMETQIVGAIYGLLAFSTVALTTLAPKMLGSYRQRFAIYIWVGVTLFIFSFLVKVFKIKNGGYPFKLLLG